MYSLLFVHRKTPARQGPWCGLDGWRPPSPPTCAWSSSSLAMPWSSARARPDAGDPPSALLDLAELQLDRGRAAEDRHRDLEARARVIDFLDHPIEGRKRPVRHPYLLADLEGHRRFR